MATLWITEYEHFGLPIGGSAGAMKAQLALEPATADHALSFTTAAQSSAFNAATRFVRLYASADCHVAFGSNPTATAAKQKLAAGVEYWRAVVAGQKVSAYDGTS